MKTALSADGTKIAFDLTGDGPPVILVVGAFNERPTGAPLAQALESEFTVLNYDRRGRGASTDTQPYAVEREIEDLDALIRAAGGAAQVFGYSSGAILALEAASHGLNITQLALYDAPFMVGDERPRPSKDVASQLAKLVTAGRRGEAVELFQTRLVGIPEDVVAQMRYAPFRPALEAIAHTLVYDATLVGDMTLPMAKLRTIEAPTLVVYGGASPAFMGSAANVMAKALPDGQVRGLEGQTHDIDPAVLGPVLLEFFGGRSVRLSELSKLAAAADEARRFSGEVV
ncbi:MAG TPA: alpha/beta hydrolase [Candidatus Dormibacteraeota bacterium]|nr:alpha/beta hydrolase [Candidatus Dormibacteraeota bacterium]